MESFPQFIEEPMDFRVGNKVMHVAKGDLGFAIPLDVFRINMRRAQKALEEHDSRVAEVVPMRRKRVKG